MKILTDLYASIFRPAACLLAAVSCLTTGASRAGGEVIAQDCFESYSATGSFVADGGEGWAESVPAIGTSQSPGLTGSGQLLLDPNYGRRIDLSSPALDPYVVSDPDGNRLVGGAGVVVWTSFYMRAGDATVITQNAIIEFNRTAGGFRTRFGNGYVTNELSVNSGTGNAVGFAGADVSAATHVVARWAYTGLGAGRIEVWLNPTATSEAELGPADGFTPQNPGFIESFNRVELLRGAQGGATLEVDDLVIATSFEEAVASCEPPDQPPTAKAGLDQKIRAGDVVFLDGSASFDDNTAAELLDYSWSLSKAPYGSTATLAGADTVRPDFLADVAGAYVVELVVTDGAGLESAPDYVAISSDNLAPAAAAGEDELIILGAGVVLDGSASTDPEGDALTFEWSLVEAPAGSSAQLDSADQEIAALTPDVEGLYRVTLTVSDFLGAGMPDTIEIAATTTEGFAETKVLAADDIVESLAAFQVTSAGNKGAFRKHLRQGVVSLKRHDRNTAARKFKQAKSRTDGCAERGSPDGNGPGRDWIKDCSVQTETYQLLDEATYVLEP